MSQRKSGYERKPRDLYETPEWVSKAIKPYIPPGAKIWEPACATGKMARVLSAAVSSDLVTNYGIPEMDFLEQEELPQGVNAIVTNPPFHREAEKFIRHGLELLKPNRGFMAMLLPVDFDSAKTRSDMFALCPAFDAKLVLTSRIVWFERDDGTDNPSSNHAWFLWNWARNAKKSPNIGYHFK